MSFGLLVATSILSAIDGMTLVLPSLDDEIKEGVYTLYKMAFGISKGGHVSVK